jgi:hypothetical protein
MPILNNSSLILFHRKVVGFEEYRLEITRTYHHCENVRRDHSKNHIYFIVHPICKTFYQKCHDPECFDFQSVIGTLPTNVKYAPVKRKIIHVRKNVF